MSDFPLPKFHFQVSFSSLDKPASFAEVSGLDMETDAIDYRDGTAKTV